MNGFWNPPPAFRFGASPLTSLSSSELTFLALFLRGAFCFLTVFFSLPPRVERPRARLFSWAWSLAARRASASSTDEERLAFFLAGSGEAEGSVEPMSEVPLVAARLFGDGSGSETGADSVLTAEMASKRASISSLMAFCRATS